MRLNPLRGAAPRFIALFALISLIATGLMTGSVLLLDHEARQSRAEEAAKRDLDLIATKLKGVLNDPEAGPLIEGVVRDVDAYAGVANGRALRFISSSGRGGSAIIAKVATIDQGTERVGVSLKTPAGLLIVTRVVEPSGPLRPAFIRYGGFAAMLAITFAVLAGLLVSRSLTIRAAAMNEIFAAAAGGSSGRRIAADDGPAEFRMLARNLNAMLDILEHRLFELRLSSDRMAHDLRTPLTRIATRLATIENSNDPVARDAAVRARGEIATLVGTMNALLDLREIETESSLQRERFRLDLAVREAIDLYEAEAEDLNGISIRADLAVIELVGSQPLIVRAVANLMDNAIHAAPRGSTVVVWARVVDARAMVEVRDEGLSLPPDLMRALDLDNTISSGWGGNGLGLTIVRAIARRHGGSIAFERRGSTTIARLTMAAT